MVFKQILVPTDFSKGSRQTLDIAYKIGLTEKRKIYLLHVIEILADTTFEQFKDFYARLERRAQKQMGTLTKRYQGGQVQVFQKIVYGNRVREILKFARDNKIDLIVMNSHKIDPQDPGQGWGTISYKVGVLSHVPVMLVK